MIFLSPPEHPLSWAPTREPAFDVHHLGGTSTSDWCERATELGDLKGSTVTVLGPIVDPDDQGYRDSFAAFIHCTGATVSYDGSTEFEAQLGDRLGSGNPPDIALFSTADLLTRYTHDGLKELSPDLRAFTDQYLPVDWPSYGTVDARSFGIPGSIDFKSLVWYSPKIFNIKGYTVPATWHELQTLTDQIGGTGEQRPWCIIAGSAQTIGGQVTDWLEDFSLRAYGPDLYDQWLSHEVPSNDPKITAALKDVGDFLQQPGSVSGEDVAVLPPAAIVNGNCTLTMQSVDFQANFPADTVHPAGGVNAFVMPPNTASGGQAGRVGGTFYGAFSDRPEVQAFQYFVASPEFANTRAILGGDISTNRGLRCSSMSAIQRTASGALQNPTTTIRYDASDLMPTPVAAAADKQLTAWTNGQTDATTLANIDAAWPSS